MLVAEDRPQAFRDNSVLGKLPDKEARNSKLLELLMEPAGELLILVAVAQEGEISRGLTADAPQSPGGGSGGTVKRGYSSELVHSPPPANPLSTVTQRDTLA
ncbi:MAG TPA: hypothetical protein VN713_01735 [Sphingomicrobium sp.]|nr:hypothetical protein [Sphingomicrobium sp.]